MADEELRGQKCTACRTGAPQVTDEELERYRRQVPDWELRIVDGVRRIVRTFNFKDFAAAMAFTVKVGDVAEDEGHHPAILTEWGRVTISWWTHKIGGLHRNDFIMAAKTDAIASQSITQRVGRQRRDPRGHTSES